MDSARYTVARDLNDTEILNARFHHQRFARHVHEGYCIGVIDQGAQQFWRSGSNHIAARNSIILVNADQVHDGHRATENGWSYRACYPTPELFARLGREFAGAGNRLPWFDTAVVQEPHLAALLRSMFDVLFRSGNTLERETAFYGTLTQVVQTLGKSHTDLAPLKIHPYAVRYVREYLHTHFADNVSIDTLAQAVQLNPFYLTRLFRSTLGLPPHRYQLQIRIQRAKEMLRRRQPLSTVALACGFNDQSHFTRHFKMVTGITPGQYSTSLSQ